jgi:hypothetical protein
MKHGILSLLLLSSGIASAALTFSVNFTTQALSDLDGVERGYFTDGLQFWDNVITGHRDGVSRTWSLTVSTFSQAASGGGVLLGSAGPNALAFSGLVSGATTSNGRFIISTGGGASFNVHPDAGPLNPLTIRHEIGHALGIGTLWEDNEVYNDGVDGNSNRTLAGGIAGQYTGAAALAAYQNEFSPGAAFIPVELDGGEGTAHGHWNEAADNFAIENVAGFDTDPGDGSAALTVLSGPNAGQSMDNELMTGVLSGSGFLSNTTIQSMYDIGFTVVPEPASTFLFALSSIGLWVRRRR